MDYRLHRGKTEPQITQIRDKDILEDRRLRRIGFRYLRYLFILLLTLTLASCARTGAERLEAPKSQDAFFSSPVDLESRPYAIEPEGFYHEVLKGETLWRISKQYEIPLDALVKINRLPDAAKIETGQLLFIPRRQIAQRNISEEEFIWPLKGKVIASFGELRGGAKLKGIDIRAPEGSLVVAAKSGRVVYSDEKMKGYGKIIMLEHGDTFLTIYAHNQENLAKRGDMIAQNTAIARVGATGRAAIPYLHFEIRKNNIPQNPFHYLP